MKDTVLLIKSLDFSLVYCKVLSFHWITLMHILDITSAGYEYDFTKLSSIPWKPDTILFLYSGNIQHRSTA